MTPEPEWRVIGQSVRGASHVRGGLPNQDAILWWPPSQHGPPSILVVSDGHGSEKSFRSQIGSRLAVETTVSLMRELLAGQPTPWNLSIVKRTAEDRLPQEMVRGWQVAVDDHLSAHPFTEGELAKLEQKRGARGLKEVLDNPRLAYGATLLAALVTPEFLLFLQLGDGDILTVLGNGDVERPLPRDARLIANETTSLCMPRAWREVQLRFQARYGDVPALILLATDGYANSFVNESAFLKVGSDLLSILRDDGSEAVSDNLPAWLRDASEAGSGDDISLGILYRADVAGSADAASADAATACAAVDDAAGAGDQAREAGVVAIATPVAEAPAGADEIDDAELRSRIVARIKQKGPTEPSKRGRLADIVGSDGDETHAGDNG